MGCMHARETGRQPLGRQVAERPGPVFAPGPSNHWIGLFQLYRDIFLTHTCMQRISLNDATLPICDHLALAVGR
jgi:hypothetical protein